MKIKNFLNFIYTRACQRFFKKGNGQITSRETKNEELVKSEKTQKILRRIIKNTHVPNLLEILTSRIEPRDFQSLLLQIYGDRVDRLKIEDIMKQYLENRFTPPSDIGQREIIQLDSLIYQKIPSDFEAIELSPVGPLGINKVLSRISQKNILSTVRNIEVIADSTIALSLECAKRRKIMLSENPRTLKVINLCTSHRMVRLQQFEKETRFTPHFRVFAMCTAGGRDAGFEKFETENLIKHIDIYLDLLRSFNESRYLVQKTIVALSDIRITEAIIDYYKIDRRGLGRRTQSRHFDLFGQYNIDMPGTIKHPQEIPRKDVRRYKIEKSIRLLSKIKRQVVEPLESAYSDIDFCFDLDRIAGIGYYSGLCFKISAENKEQIRFPLVDGGFTDWTQKLLKNRTERLLTSGIGSEFFCRNYKR